MNITSQDHQTKQFELTKKLTEIEKLRQTGVEDVPAHTVSNNLRSQLITRVSNK
jgi:hypothetical protein